MSKTKIFVIFALLVEGVWLQSCSSSTDDESSSSSARRRSSSSVAGQSSSSDNGSSSSDYSGDSSSDSDSNSSSSGGSGGSSSDGDSDNSSSGGDSGGSSSDEAGSDSSSSNEDGQQSSSSRAGSSSSSSNAISSSSDAATAVEITDPRDNKKYKTVKIGEQTWMAENLKHEPSSASGKLNRCYAQGGGQDDWLRPGDPKIEANCEKYGRLYDWATAMNLPASCATTSCSNQVTGKRQGICPSGWHLPDTTEWKVLKQYVFDIIWDNEEDINFGWDVGTKLKATSGWKDYSKVNDEGDTLKYGNGVDTYGFKAIGAGYCYSCDKLTSAEGSYSGIGNRGDGDGETARWWSATEHRTVEKAIWFEVKYDNNVLTERNENKSDLYSVRCVKD